MARGDQLARQWTIIQSLLMSRAGKPIAELAEVLGCHRRTVYRDLEALQSAGFPLYSDQDEGHSRWYLIETARQSIPIPFSMTELMALYFSRDWLRALENTVFHESLESLFNKVKATLPPETDRYLETFRRSVKVGSHPHKQYGAFREILDRVNQAILEQRVLRIDYFTMSRKRRSRREIAPYRLWFFDGTFYLIAHCYRRRDVRVFAVDRIRSIEVLDRAFSLPDEGVLDSFMAASFGVFRGENVQVAIRFSAEVAGYIREKTWHATQALTGLKDGALLFEAEVAGIEEIKYWVMQWGAHAEVLSPEALRTDIQSEASAMVARYTSESGSTKGGKTAVGLA
jgi:predicted DNA-binding transcriptional regulator YafY